MDSSTHPLLVPRVRVKEKYPFSPFKVGEIITYVREIAQAYEKWVDQHGKVYIDPPFRGNPHLFEPLPWHAERKPEEMPQYVKYNRQDDGRLVVAKVNDYENRMDGSIIAWCEGNLSFTLGRIDYPATEAEYNAYLQSQTK